MRSISSGRRWLKRSTLALAAAVAFVTPVALAAQQQTGAVLGRVTDETGTRGIEGAQVIIVGTGYGDLTDAQGNYRIDNVPAGDVQVRVRFLGYQETTTPATVVVGQSVTVDFALALAPVGVDELVVTAVGDQRKRELANSVARIDATQVVEETPLTDFADLLTGRAAGVQVLSSSGTTGAGSRIRIRGSSSVSLANEPLVYIDGARVTTDASDAFQNLTGGQTPSRLDDINPDDIESIEIVRGPSASTLYGTEAANGVVRITTKQGATGAATEWRFRAEGGVINDHNDYPANYQGVDADGDPCDLIAVSAGNCVQSEVRSANLLLDDETSPFETGDRQQFGGSVSGGSDLVDFFVSGEYENEDGVLPQNDLQRVNLRANVGASVRPDLDLRVSTGYVSSDLTLPQNDNNTLGFHLNGLFGGVEPDSWFAFSPEDLENIVVDSDIERFTGSASANWNPLGWLNVRGAGGIDVSNREDANFFPTGAIQAFGLETGLRIDDRFQSLNYTGDFSATASADPNEWLNSQTSVGLQFFQQRVEGTSSQGEDLPAGSNSIGTAAVTEATEETIESRTLGLFVQQQFGFNDRVFLTAAVRGDDNSTFGEDFDVVIYPKVGASWVLSEESFFPEASWLSSLRLRGAWGASGNQPGVTDAIRFLRGVPATAPDGVDVIGVTFTPTPGGAAALQGGLGNPDLKPERSTELEIGFDADMLGQRLGLDVTLYDKRTEDALVFRNLAPSLGVVTGRFENIGDTRNRGIEAAINAIPVRG
ncbi:MAG: SusC/RagA family TonB-linked outer membrane protein, partial [Gemmatimonadota bacterium]|nr:SusC/RagA family TonB-linked outer membrane protein [Gemmatimonadota bacterium]